MTKDDKDPTVEWSDQVKEAAAKDPKMAAALREFGEIFRTAMQGIKDGRYPSFDEAMFQLTGERPTPVSDDEDED